MKKRRITIFAAVLTLLLSAAALAACSGQNLRINVPAVHGEAYTGTYTIPRFEVVNTDGLYMAEYTVKLKSMVGPDGSAVQLSADGREANIEEPGEYVLTYTAGKRVKDAEYTVLFHRSPPRIKIDEDEQLPAFYMQNATYPIPLFSWVGADTSKSWLKFYHLPADGGEREEISLSGGFTPPYGTGSYLFLVHAEDAYGTVNEYEFVRPAIPALAEVQDRVFYFNEKYGEYQIAKKVGQATWEYTTETFDGLNGTSSVWPVAGQTGSMKVKVTSAHEFADGNGKRELDLIFREPYESLLLYDYVTFSLYNPNDFDLWVFDVAWSGVQVRIEANSTAQLLFPTANGAAEGIIFYREPYSEETGTGGELADGTEFYISAVDAGRYDVENRAYYFDREIGRLQVGQIHGGTEVRVSYSEYAADGLTGDSAVWPLNGQKGSLEILSVNGGAVGLDLNPAIDFAEQGIDYVDFTVYNPNLHPISVIGVCDIPARQTASVRLEKDRSSSDHSFWTYIAFSGLTAGEKVYLSAGEAGEFAKYSIEKSGDLAASVSVAAQAKYSHTVTVSSSDVFTLTVTETESGKTVPVTPSDGYKTYTFVMPAANVTVHVMPAAVHEIVKAGPLADRVTVSAVSAKLGTVVTLSAENAFLPTVYETESNAGVPISAVDDKTFTFLMPDADVTVSAADFVEHRAYYLDTSLGASRIEGCTVRYIHGAFAGGEGALEVFPPFQQNVALDLGEAFVDLSGYDYLEFTVYNGANAAMEIWATGDGQGRPQYEAIAGGETKTVRFDLRYGWENTIRMYVNATQGTVKISAIDAFVIGSET